MLKTPKSMDGIAALPKSLQTKATRLGIVITQVAEYGIGLSFNEATLCVQALGRDMEFFIEQEQEEALLQKGQ